MKKNLLTLMLFFAFLIAGIQDVSAQFVNENQALVIVQTEIQTIESNSVNPNTQEKTPYYAANSAKLEFFWACRNLCCRCPQPKVWSGAFGV